MSGDPEVGCVFCRIASGSDPSTTLLYEASVARATGVMDGYLSVNPVLVVTVIY